MYDDDFKDESENENEIKNKESQENIKIDRIKLTVESTILYSYKDYLFGKDWPWTYESLRKDFFDTCDRLGVKKTGEWQSLDQLKEVL